MKFLTYIKYYASLWKWRQSINTSKFFVFCFFFSLLKFTRCQSKYQWPPNRVLVERTSGLHLLEELFATFSQLLSSQVHFHWCHTSILRLAKVGIFIPWTFADATNQDWMVMMIMIIGELVYQHTIVPNLIRALVLHIFCLNLTTGSEFCPSTQPVLNTLKRKISPIYSTIIETRAMETLL